MIVSSVSELPDPKLFNGVLALDIESTSFDDREYGYHPYIGHRVAGYGLMTRDGHGWYLPVRHRPADLHQNLPLDVVQKYLKDLDSQINTIIGHNVKFDLRFAGFDGYDGTKAELVDTVVLSRLVDSTAFSADLSEVAKKYCPSDMQTTESTIKEWLAKFKTKDYGRIPIDVLGHYCLRDLQVTLKALEAMLAILPSDSQQLWEIEKKTTAVLLKSERRGVYVPRQPLLRYTKELVTKTLENQTKLEELIGEPINTGSSQQLTALLVGRLCVQPTEWTKTHQPSWNAENLRLYDTPVCDLLADLKEMDYQISAFGSGWLDRMAPDETLHPNFKQYGALTGRFACEDPNFQNLNPKAKRQVVPRKGYRFVSIDASQIEFRFFAHYTNSPKMIARYQEDRNCDYHQQTADMLGIPRYPTKKLNFGFIYGMGRDKLLAQLSVFIKSALVNQYLDPTPENKEKIEEAVKVLRTLMEFNFKEPVTDRTTIRVSSNVYNHMHRLFPEIKAFQTKVENLIKERGYVRNIYGRYYRLPAELGHKGRNYVVQGSAADYLKDCLSKLQPILDKYGAFLLANVHDEELFEVPIEETIPFVTEIVPVLEQPSVSLRVPLKVDVSICDNCWGEKVDYADWLATQGVAA